MHCQGKANFCFCFPFENHTGLDSFNNQHGSTAHSSGKSKLHAASTLHLYNCSPLCIRYWRKIKSTQELCVSEFVFSKWKHMNFKDHTHKNLDSAYYTNKLTTQSAVTFSEKGCLIKTCIKSSGLLDGQKHFSVAFSGQKLAHIFVSSINNTTKMVTLLQGYTGTVRYLILPAPPHLTTSAFITGIQRGDTKFSLQAFIAQEHAYILTTALTTESLVILLLQDLTCFSLFPVSMHQRFQDYL